MRNTVKSLLALLLVSCLLLGAVGTAFAEETQAELIRMQDQRG